MRRYFYIWAQRPLKLLIYKSKNCKYYHSLNILNNKINKLIHTIYKIYIKKYFIIFIIAYLNSYNIDINNNQLLYFLNKGNKNTNIINYIFKFNNDIKNKNNKIMLKDYLNIIDRLNTDENIDIIQKNEMKDKEIDEYRNRSSKFKIINDLDIYKKSNIKSYTPIKTRNIGSQKNKKNKKNLKINFNND